MDLCDRIESLCIQHSVSRTALERELGLSRGSFLKWKTHAPSADSLMAVAKRLDTTMEYLLTGERPAADAPAFYVAGADSAPRLTPEEEDLLRGFRACSQSDKDTMLYIARRAIIEKKGDAGIFSGSTGEVDA